MEAGKPSVTAQRVAAHRLLHQRPVTAYGDPDSDLRLATDVAQAVTVDASGLMARYLRARTTFFDQVVVRAIDRGVTQLVSVGAGYDGRALRYAAPGVQWFEVDHPDTQRDKRARLERLGIDSGDIRFVACDLQENSLAEALVKAGFEVEAPAQLLCEGVAIYLPPEVLAEMLLECRRVATAGTRLAITFSASRPGEVHAAERARFHERVAELGEAARSVLGPEDSAALLHRTGWQPAALSERAQHAGFVLALPEWGTEVEASPVVATSQGAAVMQRLYVRRGLNALPEHLRAMYGVSVTAITPLDSGVMRVDRSDGPSWVARIFPAARPQARAQADAEVLQLVAQREFPAERLAVAVADAVSVHQGQAVLVTLHVAGSAATPSSRTFRTLGDLLGRLHRGEAAELAQGGAWHHVSQQGGPRQELDDALALLHSLERGFAQTQAPLLGELCRLLEQAEDCEGLPTALIHPDFVLPNMIEAEDGSLTVVDWSGSGRGPRAWSLAFALWASAGRDLSGVDAVMAGYGAHVTLEPQEWERLPQAMLARALSFACWDVCTGRRGLADVVVGREAWEDRAQAIVERAAGPRRGPARRAR